MSDFSNHLDQISQRLSVNAPFDAWLNDNQDIEPLNDEGLFLKHYKNFHVQGIYTFSEAKRSPFFRLLADNLYDALIKLPGWAGWVLLEYYDETQNGCRLVMLAKVEATKNQFQPETIAQLDMWHHNLTLLLHAMRQMHVHIRSWSLGLTEGLSHPLYAAENKIAIDLLLPPDQNPYLKNNNQEEQKKSQFFEGLHFKPAIITKRRQTNDIESEAWIIQQTNNQYTWKGLPVDFFNLIKLISNNRNNCNNENFLGNSNINCWLEKKITDTNLRKDYLELLKLKSDKKKDKKNYYHTLQYLLDNLDETIEKCINAIEIERLLDNGQKEKKTFTVDCSKFEEYFNTLFNTFAGVNEFLYLPAFTTFKKGGTPQRKDLIIGSVTIGLQNNATLQSADISPLWRFVQAELLKWYTQYSNFELYKTNREMLLQARLNALTQVFARNESHINGSHVIRWFLENLNAGEIYLKKYMLYLQQRMELVASIQAFPGYLKGKVNMEAYDAHFYYCDNSEDNFKGNLILAKGIVDGKEKEKEKVIEIKINNSNGDSNINFFVPGNNLGKHLMLIILEGMVRNVIKHETITGDITLNYTLADATEEEFKDDYYVLNIWSQCKTDNSKEKVEAINNYLLGSVLEKGTVNLRKGGWGLIELKVAAALLIDFPLHHIDQYNDKSKPVKAEGKTYPPFIQAKLYNENKNIGYQIYLLKPKIIYTTDQGISDKIQDKNIVSFTQTFNNTKACTFYIGDAGNKNHNYRFINQTDFLNDNEITEEKCWEKYKNLFEKEIVFISNNIFSTYNTTINENGNNFDPTDKIIIDDHGHWLKNKPENEKESIKPYYYQVKATYQQEEFVLNDKIIQTKYLEAIETKVAVIDERIQKTAYTAKEENVNISLKKLYEYMLITIPNKENIDLNQSINYESLFNLMESYLGEHRYTLIHHSLFEKIYELKKTANQTITEFYLQHNKPKEGKFLVLISGLGIPSTLPEDNCYYLNLSTLQQALEEKKSKFHLVQLLYSLRPITKTKNI